MSTWNKQHTGIFTKVPVKGLSVYGGILKTVKAGELLDTSRLGMILNLGAKIWQNSLLKAWMPAQM